MEDLFKVLGDLEIEYVFKRKWRFTRSLRFIFEGVFYKIPRGFVTDLDSMIRIPFLFELFGACAEIPSALHDWLYFSGMLTRSKADRVFRVAMIQTGEPAWRAWGMWLGVRLFGAPFYKKRKGEIN